jgi:hypothetical protein
LIFKEYQPPLFQDVSKSDSDMFQTKPSKFKIGTILSPFHEISAKIKSTLDQDQKQIDNDFRESYPVEDSDEEGEILTVHGRKYFGSVEALNKMEWEATPLTSDQETSKARNESQKTASSSYSSTKRQRSDSTEAEEAPSSNRKITNKRRRYSQTRDVIVQNTCAPE